MELGQQVSSPSEAIGERLISSPIVAASRNTIFIIFRFCVAVREGDIFQKRRPSNSPLITSFVRETRVELARHCWHYLLRVARLPISPPALRMDCKDRHFLFEDNRAGKNFLANPICEERNAGQFLKRSVTQKSPFLLLVQL